MLLLASKSSCQKILPVHLKWTEGQRTDYVLWISPCCSDKMLGTRKTYKLRYQEQFTCVIINLIYLLSFGSKLFALRSMLCLPAPHRVWCLTMRRGRGSETHLGLLCHLSCAACFDPLPQPTSKPQRGFTVPITSTLFVLDFEILSKLWTEPIVYLGWEFIYGLIL